MAEVRRISLPSGNQLVIDSNFRNGNSDVRRRSSADIRWHDAETGYERRKSTINGGKKGGYEGPAVVVRHASKHFQKGVPVLNDMNMTVHRGAIYSLLGSSGAGKTTALACIVGVRKLNQGYVYVFGERPGVNGKSIGYMPQETSLYEDFTISETLGYFGTLCGMDRNAALEKTFFLKQLLRLPDISQRVGTLSGGQRRRVSFAAALVADPELLVLDEPTVGVDPLLRESIWNHLVHLSTTRGMTVLITTHYIDEAKESNAVGVMRNGRLLCEEDPTVLLNRFNTTSLESVVLQLCRKEDIHDECAANAGNSANHLELGRLRYQAESRPDDSEFVPSTNNKQTGTKVKDSAVRIKSLINKNLANLFRNLLLFFFSVLMPAVTCFVVCTSFRNDPRNLNFGIVNYEVPNLTFCNTVIPPPPGECDTENLSCKFIRSIPTDTFSLVNYKNETEAVADVHEGTLWGYMIFPEDYSSSFYERSASGTDTENDVVNKSEIIVKMDRTSNTISGTVTEALLQGFEEYAKAILRDCGFDQRQAEFPLKYQPSVFGGEDIEFIEFIGPGVGISYLFFFPIIASAIRLINEKKQGTFDRSLVAGTTTTEILFAYGCTESIVLLMQSLCVYFTLTVIIGLHVEGSVVLIFTILLLSGLGGVSMGFFVGAVCREEIEAALLAIALFFPNIFLCGLVWPVEGQPEILQYVSYVLPCTLTGESMRSVWTRAWPLSHPHVYSGFISIVGHILLFFVLTVLIQRFSKK